MKTTTYTVTKQDFRSDVRPDVHTHDPDIAEVIAWADKHPLVWKIVTSKKSKTFGRGATTYIGWAQKSMESKAVLERVRHFRSLLDKPGRWSHANSIFHWRARFTYEHFNDPGFTGGFFQQHDARFPRSCLVLDYTPETLDQVLDKFCQWMDRYYETTKVTLNGRTVRVFDNSEACAGVPRNEEG